MKPPPRASGPSVRSALAAGLGLSVGLHLALYLLASAGTPLPTVDFEIALPQHAEFGLTEASRSLLPEPAPEPAAAAPPADPGPVAGVARPARKKPRPAPRPDAGPADAGAGDAGAMDAATLAEAGASDAASRDAGAAVDGGPDGSADPAASGVALAPSGPDAGTAQLQAYAPPGTQLSLRIDMARLREAALADELRKLLSAIPDWQALLDGSGVDPLDDLERLFLASPNLSRASLVMAGEHRADPDLPRRAVARLAAARQVQVQWRTELGFAVAPWANRDSTERLVALLGENLFAITRPDDLPRVLAAAQGLAERAAREGAPDGGVGAGAALLAMPDGEALHFAVEGAQQFVRGATRGIPERLDAGVSLQPASALGLRATGQFASSDAARDARDYWQGVLDQLSRNALVGLLGLSSAIRSATLEVEAENLRLQATLNAQQTRLVLGYLENALRPPRPAPTESPVPPTPLRVAPPAP